MVSNKKIVSVMVWLVSLLWGAEYYAGTEKGFEVDNYKGVTVTHERYKCGDIEGILACYFTAWPNKWTINMERWFNEENYKGSLEHEFWHAVYFAKMSEKDRLVWRTISDGETIKPKLEKYWITTEAEFSSWYARTNPAEDFAESFRIRNDFWNKVESYLDLKLYLARYFEKKYKLNEGTNVF